MSLRNKKNDLIIFGRNPIWEELENNPKNIEEIIIIHQKESMSQELKDIREEAKKHRIKLSFTDEKKAELMAGTTAHQSVLAKLKKFSYTKYNDWFSRDLKKNEANLVLILDKIEDVGNFGALIRTAAAVGVSAIFVPEHNQAPVNGTVFKTSAGNVNKVKIVNNLNLNRVIEDLQKNDFWVYGIDMEDEREYPAGNIFEQNFSGNTAIVLGSEGKGISEKILEKCDFITPIPMENGVESLNVSVAGAIAMYEWKRQQLNK